MQCSGRGKHSHGTSINNHRYGNNHSIVNIFKMDYGTVDRGTIGSIVIERLISDIVESHQSMIGDMINLNYFVGHVGSDDSIKPSVFWLKDGLSSRTTPTNTPLTNSHLTTGLIFTFTESDSGTYQLVSLIQDGNGHLTVSSAQPVRLDTGNYNFNYYPQSFNNT